MVQLNKLHKIGFVALALIIFSLFDRTVVVSGDDIVMFSHTDFKKSYRIIYRNPLKRLFIPKTDFIILSENGSVKLNKEKSKITASGRGIPGEFSFVVKNGKSEIIKRIIFNLNREDSDSDGFPDLVELDSQEDKESFVNWFSSIAHSQFYSINDGWYGINRDCSGLVAFAFKEALKIHDFEWLQGYSVLDEQRDIEKYNYPDIPILGENCFITASGFNPGANASSLLNYNMQFIGKNQEDFKKGDVLIFYDDAYEMPYHSMIYLGNSGYVVYHTGPIDEFNTGEVRMVLLEDLMRHPDQKWHPAEYNKKFLGGYRWQILI